MIKLNSYGKINLFLNVEGRLNNGYHLIKTIMQSINLHDELFIDEISGNQILIDCNDKNIPTDSKNTCYKAAALLKEKFKIDKGIRIKIIKSIPSEAGLAGGSGNSAAVIKGLNLLWGLNMSIEEMQEIALTIGADVPFCLVGGTSLAEGIGEKLTLLEDFVWNNILIVKPNFNMSTSFVYNNLNPNSFNLYDYDIIVSCIQEQRYEDAVHSVANTLERVVEKLNPEINDIKKIMESFGALSSMMTGSGSAVFGFFPDKVSIQKAYDFFLKSYKNTFITETIDRGIEIIG